MAELIKNIPAILRRICLYFLFMARYITYGNTRPMSENVLFSAHARKFQNSSDPVFKSLGWCVKKIALETQFSAKVDALFLNQPFDLMGKSSYQYLNRQSRAILKEELVKITREVIAHAELVAGHPVHLHWLVVNRLNPGAKKPEDSTTWHSDNCPVGSLKCMVLLDSVTSLDDGPFQILSKRRDRLYATLLGFLPDHPLRQREIMGLAIERSSLSRHSKTIFGDVGCCVFFDNNLLHKGNMPKSKPRDTILYQFYPATESNYDYILNDLYDVTTAPSIPPK